ncbi:sensor histidine kinase [Robiginitalea sp. IMCC43444]|uniref:sensor histidine kinase n=1 Tax=Robiginitalea sp. IMCC43444 TaxID=3459121 RepID=UPI004041C55A
MSAKKEKHIPLSRNEILWIALFYFVFAFLYHITIKFNGYGRDVSLFDHLLNPVNFVRTSGLHYFLFFLASIPIWYLVFVKLRTWSMRNRILMTLGCLPVFVLSTQQVYYVITEYLEWGHLGGTGQVWDIYIPALFYLIQFGILYAYEHYKENQRKLIIEGELRQAALQSELAAIKAQLNPHFLYNVFNTINASVPAENEQTRAMIAQLSDLFRYQLQASQTDLVPLRDELEFVRKYLDLEKARFEDRLKINIEVAESLMDEQVPPMLLQPLVENSVKHGLSSLIEGGSIHIYIFKEEGKLRFEISDTGIGISDKAAAFDKGIGLKNTRIRLAKRYQSTLELLDNSPRGLTIRFAL